MENDWIEYENEKPENIGFYLCCSEFPYSDWNFTKDDRYEDCLAYAFYNGSFFLASNVKWWLKVPKRPNGWALKNK